jgi:hypothetical protein
MPNFPREPNPLACADSVFLRSYIIRTLASASVRLTTAAPFGQLAASPLDGCFCPLIGRKCPLLSAVQIMGAKGLEPLTS